MSLFPTKNLLATDGSDESDLATTAAELAKSTDSELDVTFVLEVEPGYLPPRGLVQYPQRYEDLKEESRRIRDRQVEKIEASGGSVSKAHLAIGPPPIRSSPMRRTKGRD
jgi:hypothetical protein